MKNNKIVNEKDAFLFDKIAELIELSRKKVLSTINLTMVYTYFEIGKMIVENEQDGKERAKYGKNVLKNLSEKLTLKFGTGYSVDNLQNMRNFYSAYSNYETASRKFQLSWSHYLKLMRLTNIEERNFYEIECIENNWSLKEFKRQFDTALYERLSLSRDKEGVKKLSKKGQIIETPKDVIKDPYILEFLGLHEESGYSENELETAIINKIEHFLLEMGKGFLFSGRQVRFTFDEDHFRVDLVLYNRLLQCFVLIDLKIGELKHQDLGQMQMYVNYYDRFVKTEFENPTIGIILCKEKNNSLVEITLPKDNNQIFASKYETILPSKEELKAFLEINDND